MNECQHFEDLLLEGGNHDYLELHAGRCTACAEQLAVEQQLRGSMGAIEQPRLSFSFNREMSKQLAAERALLQGRKWRLVVMRAYWAMTALVCLLVLTMVRWPEETLTPIALTNIAMVFALAALVPSILLRKLRANLLEMIMATMKELAR